MAEEIVVTEVKATETKDVVGKAKDFWAKFSKPVIYVGSAVILVAGGWLVYQNFIVAPKTAKANDAMFPAERIFDKMTQAGFNADSINLVLNGGNGTTGVLKIASTYSGTAVADRAHLIAGACYLHNKDFNNAVKQLEGFSTSATQIQSAAYSMLGDAYAELKNNDAAFSNYKKAATVNEKDEFTAPDGFFKAALFADAIGKSSDAIELFQKVKNNYPKSAPARDVDKYLARLGALN
ncbi:MAG: tetratricopeptide repeat protein [Sphingobacteriales bacterium]|nr:tetratricopeptide repeat protein [Sphingobacteriales bacterium]